MKNAAKPTKSKVSSPVLGRSAATGKLVLKPASKMGSVSMHAANTAVKSVLLNSERRG